MHDDCSPGEEIAGTSASTGAGLEALECVMKKFPIGPARDSESPFRKRGLRGIFNILDQNPPTPLYERGVKRGLGDR